MTKVMFEIQLLAAEWECARRCAAGQSDYDLARAIVKRGARVARVPHIRQAPSGGTPSERVRALRIMVVQWSGEYSWMLFRYLQAKPAADALRIEDREKIRELNELQQSVIPNLKERAQPLRVEVRRLEDEARRRGIDFEAIEPKIDWPGTIAVEEYQPVLWIIPDPLIVRIRRRIRKVFHQEIKKDH
ncbi:MAG: hypothetical protein ACYDCC_09720 [Actinomycetota bacterium]